MKLHYEPKDTPEDEHVDYLSLQHMDMELELSEPDFQACRDLLPGGETILLSSARVLRYDGTSLDPDSPMYYRGRTATPVPALPEPEPLLAPKPEPTSQAPARAPAPMPLVLIRAPSVLGDLGALIPAIASRCLDCHGVGYHIQIVGIQGIDANCRKTTTDCPHCPGSRGITVYARHGYGHAESERFELALRLSTIAQSTLPAELQMESDRFVRRVFAASAESYRRAVGREAGAPSAAKVGASAPSAVELVSVPCAYCPEFIEMPADEAPRESDGAPPAVCAKCETALRAGRVWPAREGELKDAGRPTGDRR